MSKNKQTNKKHRHNTNNNKAKTSEKRRRFLFFWGIGVWEGLESFSPFPHAAFFLLSVII